MRALLLAFVCSAPALAQPFATELRGGGPRHSGAEALRLEHTGANDSLGGISPGRVHDEHGVNYDRWFSNAMGLRLRVPVDDRLAIFGGVGQIMYTPRSTAIERVEQLDGDRPYSGWLAGSIGADLRLPAPLSFAVGATTSSTIAVELFAGASGPPSFAGPTQHVLHNLHHLVRREPLPPLVGWGVVETAPAATLDLSIAADTSVLALGTDVPALRFTGSHPALDARLGARVDGGRMLVAEAASLTILGGSMAEPGYVTANSELPIAAYLYARGEARAVQWNASIDGALVDGRKVARSAPLVFEAFVGAVLRVWAFELSWGHGYRSNEVATLPVAQQTGQWLWQWSGALLC